MSYSKIEWEREHPENTDPLRCLVCKVEATEGNRGRRVGDDEWLCNAHKHLENGEVARGA